MRSVPPRGVLLRRAGSAACLLIALFALFVADRAARSGEDGARRYGDLGGTSATPPAQPEWWPAPHPPREVLVDVAIRPAGDDARITEAYDITLHHDDPLVALIRTGDVESGALALQLAGRATPNLPVALRYADPQGDVHASFTAESTVRAGAVSVAFDAVPQPLDPSAALRRTVRISAQGYGIRTVGRGDPRQQDRSHATFTEAGGIAVLLEADVPPPDRGGWFPALAAWGLVMLVPWLALRRLRLLAIPVAALAVVAAELSSLGDNAAVRIGWALACLGVPALLLAVPWMAGVARPRARDLALAAAVAAGVALIPAGLVASAMPPMPAAAGWALVFGPLAGAAALALIRRSAWLGAAVALAGVAVTLGLRQSVDRSGWGDVAASAVGLVWVLPLAVVLPGRRSLWWLGGGLAAGALLLRPAAELSWEFLPMHALTMANLALGGTLLVLLAREGRDPQRLRARGTAVAAVALVLCVAVDPSAFSWVYPAAMLALWGGLLALLARDPGARLVSGATHARLVRAELRRRMLRTAAADVYRGARARLTAGPEALDEYDGAQARLDEAVDRGGAPVDGVPVGDAFTTDAGRTPVANALAAAGFAAPAAVLLITYEIVALLQQEHGGPVLDSVDVARHLLRWPVYAALFGFCYPLLRGRGPFPKALGLAAVVLVAELLPILADPRATAGGRQLAIAVLLRAGQVLVFFVVLGLLWERRLAVLADVGWSRLRDMRRITTLATPVGTVLLTVVTALGTALAGAAAAALIASQTPAPQAPRPAPSSSSGR
ncbi:hypothetical protein [Dactylosporangium sp. CS-033363]|uniref:hypothetical protein n=1 Tax=Dactylosporangium sp. CS-033363 TaxID=3239935 RepID=UPI003D8C6386